MSIKVDRIALFAFITSCAFLAFLYGVAVGKYEYFPHRSLAAAYAELKSRMARPDHLFPARYDRAGVVAHDGEMAPGVTLLTSYWREFDWQAGIRLIDAKGRILHQWRTNPAEIWSKSVHTDKAGRRNFATNYVHGCHLFENGDVIFNVEYMGLVRMDARGKVVWRLPYRTHHSVSRDESGDFWVCGLKWIENNPEGLERLARYPGLELPVVEDFAIKVSPDGEVLREVSVLDAIRKSGYWHLFWKGDKRVSKDITHLNKVEPLSTEMADQYPLFEPGDILVSLRNLDAVFVVEPDSGRIKWLTTEPFIKQHDPTFVGDGWVAIFDNNSDGSSAGGYLGGSRIIAVKPETSEVRVLYPKSDSQRFYTQAGGKFQVLENGNLLITEARAGRVFEVDGTGRTVWEWVHERFDGDLIPEVLEGSRYELTPEEISSWTDG